jgi:nucleoside-diphosphate-sugar epimerase
LIIGLSGGSGLVGQALITALINLEIIKEIRVLVNKTDIKNHKKIKKFKRNLLDENLQLKEFFIDLNVFFHCAAEKHREDLMYKLHVLSLKRIINENQNKNLRWIQLSSVGAYGNPQRGVIREYASLNSMNEYEKTKSLADKEVQNTNLKYIIVRPSILFGEGVSNKSILNLIKIIKKGLFIRIGKQNTILNYIFLDDLINALVECGIKTNLNSKTYIVSQKIFLKDLLDIFSPYSKNYIFLPIIFAKFMSLFLKFVPKFNLNISRINALTSTVYYDGTKIIQDTNFNYGHSLKDQLIKYDSE